MQKGTLMSSPNPRPPRLRWVVGLVAGLTLLALLAPGTGTAQNPADAQAEYAAVVQPLLKKYCLDCHSTELKKGSLDLERFTSLAEVRKDVKRWQQVLEMLEAG